MPPYVLKNDDGSAIVRTDKHGNEYSLVVLGSYDENGMKIDDEDLVGQIDPNDIPFEADSAASGSEMDGPPHVHLECGCLEVYVNGKVERYTQNCRVRQAELTSCDCGNCPVDSSSDSGKKSPQRKGKGQERRHEMGLRSMRKSRGKGMKFVPGKLNRDYKQENRELRKRIRELEVENEMMHMAAEHELGGIEGILALIERLQ